MFSPIKNVAILVVCIILAGCSRRVQEESSEMTASVKVESTLSNLRIRGIAQDGDGNVWIGTYRGLNRYNGHEIHQYFSTDDPHSLPDDQVWSLYVDKSGRLWVSTKGGIAYYTEQDNFQQVSLQGQGIVCRQILGNSAGDVFALKGDEILRYSEETKCFEVYMEDERIGGGSGYFDAEDMLWIVNGRYLGCFSLLTRQCRESIDLSDAPVQTSRLIGNELWMASQGSLRIYDVMSHKWLPVPEAFRKNPYFKDVYIDCISSTNRGHILIGSMTGMFSYDPYNKQVLHQSEVGFPFEAPTFSVTHTFSDRDHNLWLCSESQGVEVRTTSRRIFNTNYYLSTTFKDKPVADVEYDASEHALWVATIQEGIYRYNIETNEMHHYDLTSLSPHLANERLRPYYLLKDSRGYLWISCMPYSLMCVRMEGNKMKLVDTYKLNIPIVLKEDQQGTIWVGCYGSTFYSKRKEDKQFRAHHLFGNGISYLSCLEPLSDGSFAALVKESALRFISPETNELLPPVIAPEEIQGCMKRGDFLPTSLHEDVRGNLWMGTVTNGLMCYDRKTGILSRVEGAPCADISSIEEDRQGNIWVSTQYGLGKYNPKTRSFTNYYASDGIGGNEFYDRVSCKLPDGTLVFGGAHGLTVFDPSAANASTQTVLKLEDLKVFGHLVRPGEGSCITRQLDKAESVQLEYWQNNFNLSFSALDYSGDERYSFQYQLEGFDDRWIDADNARQAFYGNIPSGNYTFKVRVMNKDKTQVLSERSIAIHKEVAPWLSGWAYLVYFLILSALVGGFMRSYHIRRQTRRNLLQTKREQEHERQVNRKNMQFFANVSHEFRTPLTIISGPVNQLMSDASISEESRHLLGIVHRSVSRMLRLVNQMMDFHKLEDGALHLEVQRQDIAAFLRQCGELFTLQAKEKQISLSFQGIEEEYPAWFDADKVEKVVLNLLSNAMKYTPIGQSVELSLDVVSREKAAAEFPINTADKECQYVKITVADTGDGLPLEELERIFECYYQVGNHTRSTVNVGTGIGLYYTQKLVLLHHGYIKAANRTEGHGAIFTVLLPASENSYDESEISHAQHQSTFFPLPPETEEELVEEPLQEETPDKEDSRPKILVIDDETEIVLYVKTLLQRQYQVMGVFDAEAGLDAIRKMSPDLILCDVMMPGRSGYEFCKEVKSDLQLCHLPVVLLTARATTNDQVEGLGVGADAYVTKPFDPAYLLALVGSMLQNREKVRNLLSTTTQTESLAEDVLSPQDNAFMSELYHLMEQELANPELDILHLTDMMKISRTKFYYKVKGLTGENPATFFKRYKLNRASELLKEGTHSISEVSMLTGFSSTGSFSTAFKKHFGVSPSEYR